MAMYIIKTELSSIHNLYETYTNEDLTGKRTIELADDDAADYEKSVVNFNHWQQLLNNREGRFYQNRDIL